MIKHAVIVCSMYPPSVLNHSAHVYSRHLAPMSFCYNTFIVNYSSRLLRTWLKKVGHKITCPGLVHKGCQDPVPRISSRELLSPSSYLKESLAWVFSSFVFLQMLPIGTCFLWVACWQALPSQPCFQKAARRPHPLLPPFPAEEAELRITWSAKAGGFSSWALRCC